MLVPVIFLSVDAVILLSLLIFCIVKVHNGKKANKNKSVPLENAVEENEGMPCALQLKNVVKVYGQGDNKVKALKGVSIAFRKNEFVSVLGPSGCGKTTMLNIIGGLDRYTSGDLLINGVSTKQYKDCDWDTYRNNSIGFVFQSYNLIPHQTVLSNVEMALTLSGVSKAERKKRAKIVLEKVGLKGMEHKIPNQMSGGQMQRVAIARALVNDPEIILADEPTGALDTETSVQIMELLKEVAKDRLVIMVTHNPKLAEDYSTRIINLLDGEMTGDTDAFEAKSYVKPTERIKGKSAMKFTTAFSLSLSNLRTKRGRTVLTSIAGSIGIVGIALVLALSTGFSTYINKLQSDTLSVYPVTISQATIDLTDFNKIMEDNDELAKFPAVQEVYSKVLFANLTSMLQSNNLSDEYQKYVNDFIDESNESVKNKKEKWKYCLKEGYGFDVNNYLYADIDYKLLEEKPELGNLGGKHNNVMPVDTLVKVLENFFDKAIKTSNLNISANFVREYIPTISELPDNMDLLENQYDLMAGEWATEEDELMLVMGSKNNVYDITLALLGMKSIEGLNGLDMSVDFGGPDKFSFDDFLGKEFYYVPNNQRYENKGDYYRENIFHLEGSERPYPESKLLPENKMTLKIKGIIRRSPDVEQGVLDSGIAYTSKFVQRILADNMDSEIVNYAKSHGNTVTIKNPLLFKGLPAIMGNVIPDIALEDIKNEVRQIGGDDKPNKLSIYSVSYDAKEDIKKHLNKWNDEKEVPEDKVHYSDSTEMMFYALNTTVEGVKIVLIAFTAISLVVSSIMIGIITYVSVVERTKEIGVLRSLGARKKDISRIFNAETFLVGLFAGLIGVGFTYLLSIPINIIIGGLLEGMRNVVMLKILDAGILVAISFVLTLIAGIIPSRIAANKDPVVALRSE